VLFQELKCDEESSQHGPDLSRCGLSRPTRSRHVQAATTGVGGGALITRWLHVLTSRYPTMWTRPELACVRLPHLPFDTDDLAFVIAMHPPGLRLKLVQSLQPCAAACHTVVPYHRYLERDPCTPFCSSLSSCNFQQQQQQQLQKKRSRFARANYRNSSSSRIDDHTVVASRKMTMRKTLQGTE
jgi:hypothetical protein